MKYIRFLLLIGPLLTWFLLIWLPFCFWLFGERILTLQEDYKIWNKTLIDEFHNIKLGEMK